MSDFRVLLAKFYSIGSPLTSFDGQCLLMITEVDYDMWHDDDDDENEG